MLNKISNFFAKIWGGRESAPSGFGEQDIKLSNTDVEEAPILGAATEEAPIVPIGAASEEAHVDLLSEDVRRCACGAELKDRRRKRCKECSK